MAHPGVVLIIGITIASVLYYMFTSPETETPPSQHNNGPRSRNTSTSYEPTNKWTTSSARSDRVRRRITEYCSICSDTSSDTTKIELKSCRHVFHLTCIEEWKSAAKDKQCPNCRGDVQYDL